MLLKLFYDTKLAQASYLVGCQVTGDAIVVDPNRDIEQYVTAARVEGLRLSYVTETHIHADFVSGSRELAQKTGAVPVLSGEGGKDWSYAWAAAAKAKVVRDGDVVMVGNVKFEILHTPGHTPEHICFRITDTRATDRPMGVFTGDFIFVGDVGRPDLLEKAAGLVGTMDAAARQLYRSIQKFKQQPDYLQIWPGHGAGSACGKALGAVPSSTLGYERFANWALAAETEEEFVAMVLAGQPEPPAYFAHMKRINRDGPAVRGARQRPGRDTTPLAQLAREGVVLDTRRTAEFAKGHVPGTLNVPFGNSFTTYAGSIVPYGKPLHLIVAEPSLDGALDALSSIGLDDVAGWVPPEALASAGPLEMTAQVTTAEAAARLGDGTATLVDVRAQSEWDEGHVPGARHVALAALGGHLDELARAGPLILQCGSGSRSSVAASLLLAHGIRNVANLAGGINGWMKAGLPVEHDAPAEAGK